MEEKQYENAIENFEIHLPENKENYALCFYNLSTCYSNMNKYFYDKGINSILKAIEIYQKEFSHMKNNIAQSYWTYAFILSKKRFISSIYSLCL